MLKKYTILCDNVAKAVNIGIILLFVVLIISCVVQVFSRYVLNNSYRWTEESARYSFIWLHFLGSTMCVRTKTHASITILSDALPFKWQKVVNFFASTVLIVVSVVLLYGGIRMAQMTAHQMNVGIKVPMSFVYISATFSGVITLLYASELILKDISGILQKSAST
jgi:TRAP-type C4-dicarboxylate transport system permease small subunit